MSKIQKLIELVESIPEKEKRKSEVRILAVGRDKIGAATSVATELLGSCAALESIEGVTFGEKARAAILQCSNPSRQLNSKIAKKETVSETQVDEYLTRISERMKDASETIAKGWASHVQSWLRRYQPLADVARQIQLPGISGMQKAMATVSKWESRVPRNQNEAIEINDRFKEILEAIKTLGFEGKVGEFMVCAAQGNAPARDLQNAEVLAFLNKYPTVWKLLQVRL
jgi:hypothetical protein